MDEPSISWNRLIHPDTDAIKRRDEMLLNTPDYIQNEDGSIAAEIKIDWCGADGRRQE